MGLIDKIKRLFTKQKLLSDGEGTENIINESENNSFKETLIDQAQNLSPEQWQVKFLTENNINMKNYLNNPFISQFILSIPEIAEIKDKESFDRAKKENERGMDFSWESPMLSFNSNNDKHTIIYCRKEEGAYLVGIEKKGSVGKEIEERKYDSKNGIEIERNKTYIDSFGMKTKENYKRKAETIGLVELTGTFSGDEPYFYFDITHDKEYDIGTLDCAEHGRKEVCGDRDMEDETFKKEYQERVMKRVYESKNPSACKKYEGIHEIEIIEEKEP